MDVAKFYDFKVQCLNISVGQRHVIVLESFNMDSHVPLACRF